MNKKKKTDKYKITVPFFVKNPSNGRHTTTTLMQQRT